MDCYLVDFENVRTDGLQALLETVKQNDSMVVFYSDNCKNTTLDIFSRISALKLDYRGFRVSTGSKNALDFQLSSYLGYLIGNGKEKTTFHIVSEDKGFDVVVEFWTGQNIAVDRISPKYKPEEVLSPVEIDSLMMYFDEHNYKDDILSEDVPEDKSVTKPTDDTQKKKSKVSNKDLATIDEIKSLIGKNNEPEKVLTVFNQYKSRVAINNGLVKLFKDGKKTSEIYNKLKPLLISKNKS